MPTLMETLKNPALIEAEIVRLSGERDEAKREKRMLDYETIRGVLTLYTDARDGIDRCYSCGQIKHKGKPRRARLTIG